MEKIVILCISIIMICSGMTAQKQITVEELWATSQFSARSVPGFRFMNDGIHYSRLENGSINSYSLISGEKIEEIFNKDMATHTHSMDKHPSSYTFSKMEDKILLETDRKSIYRRSSRAHMYVYDRSSKRIHPVFEGKKISNALFSPDGSHIAFVFENNLYVYDTKSRKSRQITKVGKKNEIINGMADWVYEEEFSFTRAFFWSPESTKLAFIRFDERDVPEFTMMRYQDELYPIYETFKYPKVGEKNATVTGFIYEVKSKKTKKIDIGNLSDMYIPRMVWTQNDNELCVYKMNRHQNHLELLIVNASTGKSVLMLEERNKYYIDIHDDMVFLEDGSGFIMSSDKNGYRQIIYYDMQGKELANLNPGQYDVQGFYGIDERNKTVYYKATVDNPMNHKVYAASLDEKNTRCLTLEDGMHSCQFSSTFDYYVNTHSTINSAPIYTVYDRNGREVRVIEDNSRMSQLQEEYGVGELDFIRFTTEDNVNLSAWILMPHNFQPNKKYPVFMTQYGGPGSQQVTNGWKGAYYWFHQLLAQNGYIVACVDNRGTGGRGEEFRKMTYLQLGHYETIDQLAAARYLANLPFVDASRIGIFGWSYGGYMSTNCILKGNDVFNAAIAVAPVTSWKWYDTIYTERYMRTLAENEGGYRDNSPIYYADRLKGHYLIVHGEADDNVHYQHTAEMVNALVRANKPFDMLAYPNRNHGIYGENARVHLFSKILDFIYQKI
jgi:dipeptidyl-peptidase 4